ncbi:hypothetical protein CF386_06665 [Paraphotobacterium marinum]|uniref:Permease n=1 Tax=Paraphotobacterium marinum TaxID=1755811 RepID=A0A220VED0_9GAMM|nr:hypothetical protein [Paraphotobacterium marinum]ASK78699.1 hypothetical protein CF386_06665 [Paraphotobacterium marinum]
MNTSPHTMGKPGLFSFGDLNGFLGLLADNLANFSLLTGILLSFSFPSDIIFKNIYPATVMIIVVGNLLMTFVAKVVSQKNNLESITAMPYGLDLPTCLGIPLIIGPLFLSLKSSGINAHEAGLMAWQGGMAGVFIIAALKILASPVANYVTRIVPMSGLLGSLAGIGFMIGIFALKEVFELPLLGIISLGFVLYTLIAKVPFPKRLPGLLIGVILCTFLYQLLGSQGLLDIKYIAPKADFNFLLPSFSLDLFNGFNIIYKYLPAIIPYAILVIIGDINVTVSAMEVGAPYKPKQILFLDGCVTLLGAFFGSITQTTAYAGQPAYKAMDARIGYTLYLAVIIAALGSFGVISFLVQAIPSAIFAPILIFVSMEITAQGFASVKRKHYVASAFAMFPSAIKPVLVIAGMMVFALGTNLSGLTSQSGAIYKDALVLNALINGNILTGMLWGGLVAELIDKKLKTASVYLFILSIFSFFGIIHSVDLNGLIYLPWHLDTLQKSMCYQISVGYLILGIMFLVLSFQKSLKKSITSN